MTFAVYANAVTLAVMGFFIGHRLDQIEAELRRLRKEHLDGGPDAH